MVGEVACGAGCDRLNETAVFFLQKHDAGSFLFPNILYQLD